MDLQAVIGAAFVRHRRFLWGLCYRMTGSSADADELVQQTFVRTLEHPPPDVTRDLKPWLTRVATNACVDQLRSRQAQTYIGPSLPAPIETPHDDPMWRGAESSEARYDRLESVSFAFLRAIEVLSVTQRAVLLLRDVFDFSVRETAEVLELSEANVKTTLHRAREAMARYDAARAKSTAEQRAKAMRALRAFLFHLATNDVDALRALLSEDVVMLNDGAGEFFAARKPVFGFEKILMFHRKTLRPGRPRLAFRTLNGAPAVVFELPPWRPGTAQRMVGWVELDRNDRIAEINYVVATRKLTGVSFEGLRPLSLRHIVAAGFAARAWRGAVRALQRV